MPSLPNLKLGRRTPGADVVGLDIQPGFVAAVQARVTARSSPSAPPRVPLAADTMREGEVVDEVALGEALRELFAEHRLGKRVRVGVANQRTVLRTLELPPVTDQKELAAAVRFQAQDQVPMPLNNAVLDFHPLGIVDTPAGPRQRVVLVAAQRDMVERLLAAVREAGLTAEGVDLSAFALIRSLYHRDEEQDGRVLYLNVDGLTNLAIAEGRSAASRASSAAGWRGWPSSSPSAAASRSPTARALLRSRPLGPADEPADDRARHRRGSRPKRRPSRESTTGRPGARRGPSEPLSPEDHEAREIAMGYSETIAAAAAGARSRARARDAAVGRRRARVLENGIRDISGEVRNSLDFHRSQDGGGEVSHVVLSGAAQDIPGFAEALQVALGVEVRSDAVGVAEPASPGQRLHAPPRGRHGPRRRGGAPMRAVNLIPAETGAGVRRRRPLRRRRLRGARPCSAGSRCSRCCTASPTTRSPRAARRPRR